MNLKKLDWKPAVWLWALFTVVFVVGIGLAALDHTYPVFHHIAVAHPGYEPIPETYTVQISPAQDFAQTWNVWRVIGILAWFALGAFFIAEANDLIGQQQIVNQSYKKETLGTFLARVPVLVVAVLLFISVACFFTKHSRNVDRFVNLSASEYKAVEGDQSALHKLFE